MRLWDAFIRAGRYRYIYSISAMNKCSAKKKADAIAKELEGKTEKILVQKVDNA